MNALFSTHRGRLVKRLGILAVVASIALLIFGGGGGAGTATSSEGGNDVASVDYARVYPSQESVKPEPEETATTTAPVDLEKQIAEDTKEVAKGFVEDWTTFDYAKPPSYSSLSGAAKSEEHGATLRQRHEEHVSEMKRNKELSTGSVVSVSVSKVNYSGDLTNGTGEGVIRANVSETVSNSKVGSAGIVRVREYDISVKRSFDSSDDSGEWVVTDITVAS